MEAAAEALKRELANEQVGDKGDAAISTLLIYLGNVLKDPEEAKYHRIGTLNKVFTARVACYASAKDFLVEVGFKEGIEENFMVLQFPSAGDKLSLITKGKDLLESLLKERKASRDLEILLESERQKPIIASAMDALKKKDVNQAEALIRSLLPPPFGTLVPLVQSNERVVYYDFENELERQFFIRYWKTPDEQREVRISPLPVIGSLSFMAFIAVEKRNFDLALDVLEAGVQRNPLRVGFYEERSEVYKMQRRFSDVWKEVQTCYSLAYRPGVLAKCYRAWGFCLVEWERWDEAIACFLWSLQYEAKNPTALGELEYIDAKRPGGIPDIQDFITRAPTLLEKAGIPLGPDERWTNLALDLGEKNVQESNWKLAAFYFNVAYELLKDGHSLSRLNYCLSQLAVTEGSEVSLPALSSRYVARVNVGSTESGEVEKEGQQL